MRTVICFICFICNFVFDSFERSYATSLEELNSQLSRINAVKAQFTSSKHLESLNTTLNTRGEFFISRIQGIVLKQTDPFFLNNC